MPNFICKALDLAPLPTKRGKSEFISIATELRDGAKTDVRLVLTRLNDERFLLIIKKRADGAYIIKGDKISKPTNIAILQSALSDFKQAFCKQIISNAITSKGSVDKLALSINEDELASIAKYFSKDNNAINAHQNEEINSLECFDRLCLEIGFGSGAHLLYRAQNEPKTLFAGIEIHRPSLKKVSSQAKSLGLKNLLLLNMDARNTISLLPSNALTRIYVHFPVPWNKSPSRRVINADFAAQCARVLKSGGAFELRSDDREFFDASCAKFLDLDDANLQIYKNRSLDIISKYEKRWLNEHKDIYDMLYTCTTMSQDKQNDSKDYEFGKVFAYDILKGFTNKTFKFDDFFVHLQGIFVLEESKQCSSCGLTSFILSVSYGSFDAPNNSYIIVQNHSAHYLKTPIKTSANLKAHSIIREYLSCQIS